MITHNSCCQTTSKLCIGQFSYADLQYKVISYCVNLKKWKDHPYRKTKHVRFDMYMNAILIRVKMIWSIDSKERIKHSGNNGFILTQDANLLTQLGWKNQNLMLHIWKQPPFVGMGAKGIFTIVPLQTYNKHQRGQLYQRMDQREEILVIAYDNSKVGNIDIFVIHLESKMIIWNKRFDNFYKHISGIIVNETQKNTYSLYLKNSQKIYCV